MPADVFTDVVPASVPPLGSSSIAIETETGEPPVIRLLAPS